MRRPRTSYSLQQLEWLKAHSTLPRAKMHSLFVQTFPDADVSQAMLTSLCKRKGWLTGRTGCFAKGNISPNRGKKGSCAAGSEKGWFKHGELTGRAHRLYKPIGTERVTLDGYIERKVNDCRPLHKRWRTVHTLNWEAINGPVPPGHYLKCLDGDRQNTDPSNWALLPEGMKTRLNGRSGRGYDEAEPELKPIILAIAKLEHLSQTRKNQSRSKNDPRKAIMPPIPADPMIREMPGVSHD